MMLNAILWITEVEVPKSGGPSSEPDLLKTKRSGRHRFAVSEGTENWVGAIRKGKEG